jgi:cysteine synthase A
MSQGILSEIGNTPLVKLSRVFEDCDFDLYAKLEGFNPGGSIKDRAAINIIRNAFATGAVRAGTTVIESSSGNMGIGLAQVCAYYGLAFICVIDPKTTKSNIAILRAYGAEIDFVSKADPETGEFLQARIDRVGQLLSSIPNSYWPNQYSNRFNFQSHYRTMSEVVTQLEGGIDYLFCATSTCGTARGCAEFVRANSLRTKVMAVDAEGSMIFSDRRAKRLIPGHGASMIPKLHRPELIDKFIHVSDLDCIVGCRRLVRKEALLLGGSSGGVLMAIDQIKDLIEPGATCVAIFADRGERYLDTIYSDSWVSTHFEGMTHLWQEQKEEQACVAAM